MDQFKQYQQWPSDQNGSFLRNRTECIQCGRPASLLQGDEYRVFELKDVAGWEAERGKIYDAIVSVTSTVTSTE